jgi:cytochrome c oxidase assembly protein subunit 15
LIRKDLAGNKELVHLHPAGANRVSYNRRLHLFATFVAISTLFLIFVGGLVTSTDSGLSVPDWPLSYGQVFPPMVGGVFYEHGHRMVAATVGILTIVLAVWLWKSERRRWLRGLGLAAVLAVVLQGTLGGITVLYHLPTPVSVAHAGLAQIFLCLTVSIAVFTSRGWLPDTVRREDRERPSLRTLSALVVGAVYIQTLLGALLRHTRSGLAIPDFPLSFGQLIPPEFTRAVAINFAHRCWALMVVSLVIWTCARVLRTYRVEASLQGPTTALLGGVLLQVVLGAETVWSGREVIPTTLHVACGAFILAASVVLALRVRHLFLPQQRMEAARVAQKGIHGSLAGSAQ